MNQGFVYLIGAVVALFLASSIFSPISNKPNSTPTPPQNNPPQQTPSSDSTKEALKSKLPPELAASLLSKKLQDVCVFIRTTKEEKTSFTSLMKSMKSFFSNPGSLVVSLPYSDYPYLSAELPKSAVPILTTDSYPEYYQRLYHQLTADLYCIRPYFMFLTPQTFLFKSVQESDIFDSEGRAWVFVRNETRNSPKIEKSLKDDKKKTREKSEADQLYTIENLEQMSQRYLGLPISGTFTRPPHNEIVSEEEIEVVLNKEIFPPQFKPKIFPLKLLKETRERIQNTLGITVEKLIHDLSHGRCDQGIISTPNENTKCFLDVEVLLSSMLQTSENSQQKLHWVNVDKPYESLTQEEKLRLRRNIMTENKELFSLFLKSRDSHLSQSSPSLSLSRELEFSSPVYNDFVNSVLTGSCSDGVELSVEWDYLFCSQYGVPFTNHLFYPDRPPVEHRTPSPPKKRRKPPTS